MRVVAVLLSTGLVAAQTTSTTPVTGSVVSSSNPVYYNTPVSYNSVPATYSSYSAPAYTSYSSTPVSYSSTPVSYSSAPASYSSAPASYSTTPISYSYSAPASYSYAPVSYSNSIYGLSSSNYLSSSLGYYAPQAVATPTAVYGYQFTGYDSYGSPIISDPSQPIANAPAPVAFTQPPMNGKAQPAVTAVASYNPYWGQWLYNVDMQPTQVTTGPSVTASLGTANTITQSLSPVTGSVVGAPSSTPVSNNNIYYNSAPQYYTSSAPQYYTSSAPQYYTSSAPQYYSSSSTTPQYYTSSSNIYGYSSTPVASTPVNTLASAFGFSGR